MKGKSKLVSPLKPHCVITVLVTIHFMITGITPFEYKEYQRVALEKHNELRARHGGPDMIMSQTLNDLAERCAQVLVAKNKCDHSCWLVSNKSSHWRQYFNERSLGENCWSISAKITRVAAAAIAPGSWYEEINEWNFEENKQVGEAGHFTQAIWRGSTQLGFGVASNWKLTCAVAKYYPGGNIVGSYGANVRPRYIHENAKPILDKLEKARLKALTLSPAHVAKSISPALLLCFPWLTMFLSKTMSRKGVSLLVLGTVLININSASASGKEYQQAGLDAHNHLRADHGGPPLTLNEKLNEVAEKCAEYYATVRKTIDHSCPHKEAGMGENLYAGWGKKDPDEAIAKEATQLWYDEIRDYNYANPKSSDFKKTGHFTQLVWKGSTELGFGVAFRNERSEFIVAVAIYTPGGNVQDNGDWKHYKENVVKPVVGSHGAGLVKEEGSGAAEMAANGIMIMMVMTCVAVALG